MWRFYLPRSSRLKTLIRHEGILIADERLPQIALDVRMAPNTGIGRYIRGTISALNIRPAQWTYTLIGKKESQKDFPKEFAYLNSNTSIYGLTEQFVIPKIAQFADCLHVPHYNVPLRWSRKLVVTIHDLIHLKFLKDLNPAAAFYAKVMLPLAAQKADAIIAVSEHTKRDLIEKLNIPEKKITVIHHGIDPFFLSGQTVRNESVSDPYFLYVGLIKSHKNLGVLIEAFKDLKNKIQMKNLKLRIVGRADQKQKVVRQWLDSISEAPDIQLETGLEDSALKLIYQNAAALIFPSLYEGFGFPLIEAMASKIPVVASTAASIPEVLGPAALYFDPNSTDELVHCMQQILTDNALRQKLIIEGEKRIKFFNWRDAAQKTEQVYESVLYAK